MAITTQHNRVHDDTKRIFYFLNTLVGTICLARQRDIDKYVYLIICRSICHVVEFVTVVWPGASLTAGGRTGGQSAIMACNF